MKYFVFNNLRIPTIFNTIRSSKKRIFRLEGIGVFPFLIIKQLLHLSNFAVEDAHILEL